MAVIRGLSSPSQGNISHKRSSGIRRKTASLWSNWRTEAKWVGAADWYLVQETATGKAGWRQVMDDGSRLDSRSNQQMEWRRYEVWPARPRVEESLISSESSPPDKWSDRSSVLYQREHSPLGSCSGLLAPSMISPGHPLRSKVLNKSWSIETFSDIFIGQVDRGLSCPEWGEGGNRGSCFAADLITFFKHMSKLDVTVHSFGRRVQGRWKRPEKIAYRQQISILSIGLSVGCLFP